MFNILQDTTREVYTGSATRSLWQSQRRKKPLVHNYRDEVGWQSGFQSHTLSLHICISAHRFDLHWSIFNLWQPRLELLSLDTHDLTYIMQNSMLFMLAESNMAWLSTLIYIGKWIKLSLIADGDSLKRVCPGLWFSRTQKVFALVCVSGSQDKCQHTLTMSFWRFLQWKEAKRWYHVWQDQKSHIM